MSTDAFPACPRCGGPRIEPFCGNCDYQPPPWPDYPRAIIEDMVRFSRMPYGIEARRPHPAAPVASGGVEVRDRQWMRAIRHLAEHVGAELEADGVDIGDAFDVPFGALAMAMVAGADDKRDPSWIVEAVADAAKMGTPEETKFKPILTVER